MHGIALLAALLIGAVGTGNPAHASASAVVFSGVVEDQHGNVAAGAYVYLSAANSCGSQSTVATVVTGSNGAFSMSVSPATYDLRVATDPNSTPGFPSFVTCAPGRSLTGDLVQNLVIPVNQLTVTVHDTTGSAVAGATVQSGGYLNARSFNLLPGIPSTVHETFNTEVTSSQGVAVDPIIPLTAGSSLTLSVTPPAGSSLGGTTIATGDMSTDTSVTANLASAVVFSGVVEDQHGNVAAGAYVYLSGANSCGSQSTVATVVTGSNGAFSVSVSPATYDLRVATDPNSTPGFPSFVTCAPGLSLSGDLVQNLVIPVNQLTVTVHDTAGSPVAGATVQSGGYLNAQPFNLLPGIPSTVHETFNTEVTSSQGVAVDPIIPLTTGSSLTLSVTPPTGSSLGGTTIATGDMSTDTSITATQAGTLHAPTTTALSSSANPSVTGQPTVFTATVTGPPTPSGTITFTIDGAAQSPVTLTSGGATLSTTTLAAGSHTVTAVYSGDAYHAGSTSSALVQTVNQAATTTALVSSVNPSQTGQSVTITATTAPVSPGVGVPTGTIVFTIDGTATAPVSLVSGSATVSLATLVPGDHTITAEYSGDAGFAGSTSSALTQTVDPSTCPCSVFSSTSSPGTVDPGDASGVELGVKVRTTVPGYITGVRFYKAALNTGTHTGSLWAADGTLLASGTFTDETATGWQTLTFATPIGVKAGVTYVVSYYAPSGHYSFDGGYFATSGAGSGPITALQDGTDGGDGLFAYGSSSAFPSNTYRSANYWVDAVLVTTGVPTTPPAVTATTPTDGSTGQPVTTDATATFSAPLDPASLRFTLIDANGAQVPGVVSYDSTTMSAKFTPGTQLPPDTTFTLSVQAANVWGQAMSEPVTWSFTTGSTPPAYSCPCSLFPTAATPMVANSGDTNSAELGVRVTPAVNGAITGIRFYKGSLNTGTHTGSLWAADGTLLATGTFTDETTTGWQTLTFTTPVPVSAGTTYVASYHAPNGNYSYSPGYFNYPHTLYPLTAPSRTPTAGNGMYVYGNPSTFPNDSAPGTNYWVDVLLTTS